MADEDSAVPAVPATPADPGEPGEPATPAIPATPAVPPKKEKPKPKPKKVRKPKPKPTHAVLGDATEAYVEGDVVVLYGIGRFKTHGHLRFAISVEEAKAFKKFLAKALR